MENHPIPQDVTGFKFRLIGSITLKQFLYLLAAGGIDLAIYFLPIPMLLKIPIMAIPAVIALALAFVPIDGRPMDKMIMNFLKALPAENEYIFKKQGVDMPYFAFNAPAHTRPTGPTPQEDTKTAQRAMLLKQLSKSYFNADEEEQKDLQNVTALFQSAAPTSGFVNRVINADAPPAVAQNAPQQEVKSQSPTSPAMPQEITAKEEKKLSGIAPLPSAPQEIVPEKTPPIVNTSAPQAPIQPPIAQATPPAAAPTQNTTSTLNTAPAAIPAQQISTAPTASYESPNVIEGIVKDPRGKPLPHVIVEILDENNIPKRTFRTGQNGMFISATPMPPGVYTIHLEDTLKKQEFEDKKIEINGTVLPVLEITSVDQREKLRRELFGQTI